MVPLNEIEARPGKRDSVARCEILDKSKNPPYGFITEQPLIPPRVNRFIAPYQSIFSAFSSFWSISRLFPLRCSVSRFLTLRLATFFVPTLSHVLLTSQQKERGTQILVCAQGCIAR
jgi:hypothetical protein